MGNLWSGGRLVWASPLSTLARKQRDLFTFSLFQRQAWRTGAENLADWVLQGAALHSWALDAARPCTSQPTLSCCSCSSSSEETEDLWLPFSPGGLLQGEPAQGQP